VHRILYTVSLPSLHNQLRCHVTGSKVETERSNMLPRHSTRFTSHYSLHKARFRNTRNTANKTICNHTLCYISVLTYSSRTVLLRERIHFMRIPPLHAPTLLSHNAHLSTVNRNNSADRSTVIVTRNLERGGDHGSAMHRHRRGHVMLYNRSILWGINLPEKESK
jgi:hypothetical protein